MNVKKISGLLCSCHVILPSMTDWSWDTGHICPPKPTLFGRVTKHFQISFWTDSKHVRSFFVFELFPCCLIQRWNASQTENEPTFSVTSSQQLVQQPKDPVTDRVTSSHQAKSVFCSALIRCLFVLLGTCETQCGPIF